MLLIGNHTSVSKGYAAMGRQMLKNGGNTFSFFVRNPRGGNIRELDPEDIRRLKEILYENHFGKLVAHAPYTLNCAAAKEEVRDFARRCLSEDIQRMDLLGAQYYNFHPGCHVGQGEEIGIEKIGSILNEVIRPEQETIVLLETMSGKGSEVGGSFESLARILDKVREPEKMGVCLDTCHIWDAGYDLVSDPEGVLAEFDRIIGLEKLYAVHFNDSMNPLGSRKDRHARIGEGKIGKEGLIRFLTHPALAGKPVILETPQKDEEGYAQEIAMIRAAFDGQAEDKQETTA